MKIPYVKFHPDAKAPVRGSTGAAGYDLHSIGDFTLADHDVTPIATGIGIAITDPKVVGIICDRSGLAVKAISTAAARLTKYEFIKWLQDSDDPEIGFKEHPLGRIIDSDFRGEIKVIMANISGKPYVVKKADRVAQILFFETLDPKDVTFDLVDKLPDTIRGEGGLGSTGS